MKEFLQKHGVHVVIVTAILVGGLWWLGVLKDCQVTQLTEASSTSTPVEAPSAPTLGFSNGTEGNVPAAVNQVEESTIPAPVVPAIKTIEGVDRTLPEPEKTSIGRIECPEGDGTERSGYPEDDLDDFGC